MFKLGDSVRARNVKESKVNKKSFIYYVGNTQYKEEFYKDFYTKFDLDCINKSNLVSCRILITEKEDRLFSHFKMILNNYYSTPF